MRERVDHYVAVNCFIENGFRDASDSRLSHAFAKLGCQREGSDLALSYQYQPNKLKQPGSLPLSILEVDRQQNLTVGDLFKPTLYQAIVNARQTLGVGFSLALNSFVRALDGEQFNINPTSENTLLFNHTLSGGGTFQLMHEGQIKLE